MDTQNLSQGTPNAVQKSSTRYYFYMMLLGVFVTTTAASFFAPGIVTWWYDPPAPNPMSAACVPAIEWAIKRVQGIQLGAMVVGAIIGLILALKFRTKRS